MRCLSKPTHQPRSSPSRGPGAATSDASCRARAGAALGPSPPSSFHGINWTSEKCTADALLNSHTLSSRLGTSLSQQRRKLVNLKDRGSAHIRPAPTPSARGWPLWSPAQPVGRGKVGTGPPSSTQLPGSGASSQTCSMGQTAAEQEGCGRPLPSFLTRRPSWSRRSRVHLFEVWPAVAALRPRGWVAVHTGAGACWSPSMMARTTGGGGHGAAAGTGAWGLTIREQATFC